MAQRRRWLRRGLIVLLVIAVVLVVSIYIGGKGNRPIRLPGPNSALTNSSVTPLPVGTVINASSVVAIQMFSASNGVAIATFWNKNFTSLENSYLTTTVNGGTSWRITGVLPTGSWNPLGQGTGLIAFASPREGYIDQPAPRLGTFPLGSLTPTSDTVIPSLSVGSTKVPPQVLAALGRTGLDVEDSTLITTSDSGASWRRLTDPCPGEGLGEAQLASDSRWYMLCGRGVGTMKAYNWLYKTADSGRTWTLVAKGSPLRDVGAGNIGPYAVNAFGVSNDGREMWIDGGPGFLEVSSDGGRQWHFAGTIGAKTNITGPYFVSVGHEVWMPIEFGGLVRATRASSWKIVAESSGP